MEQTFTQEVTGASLIFVIQKEEAVIISCHVKESRVEIPESLEGVPVTGIAKKAALSNKILRELVLPETIREIGDWAFAHCSRLKEVRMPRKAIVFGKGVFKDCSGLSHISFLGEENEKLSALLAAVPVMLEAEYLLSPTEAGEETWLQKLDARILALMQKPDREGYSKQVLCGEEDLMASLEVYLEDRKRQKARLCYLRLLNNMGLKKEQENFLEAYLKANTKGCESEAAWRVVLEENGANQEYYRIFTKAGCVTQENFAGLLLDMGERYPDMKAYLLKYQEENRKNSDFFAELSFD